MCSSPWEPSKFHQNPPPFLLGATPWVAFYYTAIRRELGPASPWSGREATCWFTARTLQLVIGWWMACLHRGSVDTSVLPYGIPCAHNSASFQGAKTALTARATAPLHLTTSNVGRAHAAGLVSLKQCGLWGHRRRRHQDPKSSGAMKYPASTVVPVQWKQGSEFTCVQWTAMHTLRPYLQTTSTNVFGLPAK